MKHNFKKNFNIFRKEIRLIFNFTLNPQKNRSTKLPRLWKVDVYEEASRILVYGKIVKYGISNPGDEKIGHFDNRGFLAQIW